MIIGVLFVGLLLLLFTGLPIFAGLAIFGGVLQYATQGELGSVTEVIFGEVNRYLLVDQLSPQARRWTQAWAALAASVVAAVLIINGWETAALARMLGLLTEGNLEWPTWMLMLLMPIGGALLLLAAVEVFWRAVVGLPALGKSGHAAGNALTDPE